MRKHLRRQVVKHCCMPPAFRNAMGMQERHQHGSALVVSEAMHRACSSCSDNRRPLLLCMRVSVCVLLTLLSCTTPWLCDALCAAADCISSALLSLCARHLASAWPAAAQSCKGRVSSCSVCSCVCIHDLCLFLLPQTVQHSMVCSVEIRTLAVHLHQAVQHSTLCSAEVRTLILHQQAAPSTARNRGAIPFASPPSSMRDDVRCESSILPPAACACMLGVRRRPNRCMFPISAARVDCPMRLLGGQAVQHSSECKLQASSRKAMARVLVLLVSLLCSLMPNRCPRV